MRLFFAVTPITTYSGKSVVGNATGFFYEDRDKNLYLVTNRHVVIDEKKGYFPDRIVIRVHVDLINIKRNRNITIELYDDEKKPVWLEHKNVVLDDYYGCVPDVVAIPIEKEDDWVIDAFSKRELPPAAIDLLPGDDLIVLGYPLGFYDEEHNLPIARKASIASIYRTLFRGMPCFLIDAKLHPGTSGSPVLTKPSVIVTEMGNVLLSTERIFYLIGINSGAFPNLDLGVVWYAELIEEIINKGKRGEIRE